MKASPVEKSAQRWSVGPRVSSGPVQRESGQSIGRAPAQAPLAAPKPSAEVGGPKDVFEKAVDIDANEILPGLFLGSENAGLSSLADLKRLGITHVLVAGRGLSMAHQGQLEYEQLKLVDISFESILPHLAKAHAFIGAGMKDGKVLVHCAEGVSRSASIVISYLMATEQMSYADALHHVRGRRPKVSPNAGFEAQLRAFGAAGCDASAALLALRGASKNK